MIAILIMFMIIPIRLLFLLLFFLLELWMGTHSNGPSSLKDSKELLSEWLKGHPQALGEEIVKRWPECHHHYDLPFLFKVLSIDKGNSYL